MKTLTARDTIRTLTTHYIDGAFVESHGREVMDIVRPTDSQVIARVALADEKDTQRAIAAAKRALVSFGRSTSSMSPARRYCRIVATPPPSVRGYPTSF